MDKKNYKLEFLYDNGITEIYETGEVTENELKSIADTVYQSFSEGLNAVVQIPNGKDGSALINVLKVTRVSILQ